MRVSTRSLAALCVVILIALVVLAAPSGLALAQRGNGDVAASIAGAGISLLCCPAWFIINILLLVWVYNDAKNRGENGAMWALIVLVGGIIGIIFWLIVRPKAKIGSM